MADITKSAPLISICIPAYKNMPFLKRLFDSLKSQTFAGFEIIITDDSPDNSIRDFLATYKIDQPVFYYKNQTPLGTPANWNKAISHAKGVWIKLIHDDDWLSSNDTLSSFVHEINKNPTTSFIFSSFCNILPDGSHAGKSSLTPRLIRRLERTPEKLLAENLIGPPSVTLYKRDCNIFYDTRLKWLVDVEFYLRILKLYKPAYISKPIINIGVSEEQVTKYSFGVKEVELPEYLYILEVHGTVILRQIRVYDAYWRMLRNLHVKEADINLWDKEHPSREVIISMTRWQNNIPARILRIGIVSKAMMALHFVLHRDRIMNAKPRK